MKNMAIKRTILDALSAYRGDDLYRAKANFKFLSDEEMDSMYGQSGKTRRQLLAEYEAFNQRITDAIAFVEEL